ncbi:hypothetical protein [Fodinibius halophilus]|uniref:Lipoprotein n=1 Tax=Fodinibius halophilus TaxID=1736908 RepID=A0A6M1TAG0_9BACT|nr:hypothetical protein [Fodinibius halophilus]NGP89021.1 hypothetical protein [Fodinibius halophilus]
MKFIYLSIVTLIAVAGCASSSSNNEEDGPEEYENLVSLQQPNIQQHEKATVYIDSVKKITVQQQPALLISGTFPDACTKLKEVTHSISNEQLSLEIIAWRDPDTMCAQVLTPFNYIYDKLTKKQLSAHSSIIINDTEYSY